MNIYPQTMLTAQLSVWLNASQIGKSEPAFACSQTTGSNQPAFQPNGIWENDENRRIYMESCVEQDMAWQIKVNRIERGLSQSQLAKMIGTRQSAISRLEDDTYGSYSIPMLIRIAHAFDCALLVKFISYSKFAEEVKDTSIEGTYVKSFQEEKHLLGGK